MAARLSAKKLPRYSLEFKRSWSSGARIHSRRLTA